MKIRFLRSGQTVLNGSYVTRADICTVNKELGNTLIDSGKWEAVEETAEEPKPKLETLQAEGQE